MRIDVHHHFLHRAHMLEEAERVNINHGASREKLLSWTPEETLEAMDRCGIDVAIGSIATPGVWYGDVAAARRLSRRYNEASAELVRQWPRRFGMFAVIAPPDPDGALSEIEYALDTLGADGIGVFTNYDGRYLSDPDFAPVFEELDRRRATLFVHPIFSVSAHALANVLPPLIEFPFDTTRAIVDAILHDMVSRYPGITWIFSHAGGTVPFLAARIDTLLGKLTRSKEGEALRVEGAIGEMRKLHFDIAGPISAGAVQALRALMPMDRLLFGSDMPMADPQAEIEELDHVGLGEEERRDIESQTALRLFPRLAP